MDFIFNTIVWNPSISPFSIFGFEVRYYSLCWVIALLSSYYVVKMTYKKSGVGEDKFEPLFMYCFIGILIGARLGHCLFYEFDYYITKPWAILTEFRNGGMASHGSAIGMLLGMWITSRKHRMPYVWWLDRIMIPVTIGGALVRFGNLINSEIVGKVTDVAWGFKFVRLYPNMPIEACPAQHPGQLYEA